MRNDRCAPDSVRSSSLIEWPPCISVNEFQTRKTGADRAWELSFLGTEVESSHALPEATPKSHGACRHSEKFKSQWHVFGKVQNSVRIEFRTPLWARR